MFTVLSRATLHREGGPDVAVSLAPEIETLSLLGAFSRQVQPPQTSRPFILLF